jgi:hypothetical protein
MIPVPFAGFVNLAYQPPYNNIFLSEQINHQLTILFSQNKTAPTKQLATSQTNNHKSHLTRTPISIPNYQCNLDRG